MNFKGKYLKDKINYSNLKNQIEQIGGRDIGETQYEQPIQTNVELLKEKIQEMPNKLIPINVSELNKLLAEIKAEIDYDYAHHIHRLTGFFYGNEQILFIQNIDIFPSDKIEFEIKNLPNHLLEFSKSIEFWTKQYLDTHFDIKDRRINTNSIKQTDTYKVVMTVCDCNTSSNSNFKSINQMQGGNIECPDNIVTNLNGVNPCYSLPLYNYAMNGIMNILARNATGGLSKIMELTGVQDKFSLMMMGMDPIDIIHNHIDFTNCPDNLRAERDAIFNDGNINQYLGTLPNDIRGDLQQCGFNRGNLLDNSFRYRTVQYHIVQSRFAHNGMTQNDLNELCRRTTFRANNSTHMNIIHSYLHILDELVMVEIPTATDPEFAHNIDQYNRSLEGLDEYRTDILNGDPIRIFCFEQLLNNHKYDFLMRDTANQNLFVYPYTITLEAMPEKIRQYERLLLEASTPDKYIYGGNKLSYKLKTCFDVQLVFALNSNPSRTPGNYQLIPRNDVCTEMKLVNCPQSILELPNDNSTIPIKDLNTNIIDKVNQWFRTELDAKNVTDQQIRDFSNTSGITQTNIINALIRIKNPEHYRI
jgi:hypothetical protein